MRLLQCILCDTEEQPIFQVLVHTKCWAYMVQEKSAQAGHVADGKWRFDSKTWHGQGPDEESAGPHV